MSQPGTTLARVRLLVLRRLPVAAFDLVPPGETPEGRDLVGELLDRGLERVPGLYDVDLPRHARVGLARREGAVVLQDEEEAGLLRIPESGLDEAWLQAARRLKGAMVYAGTGLELTAEASPREVCDRVDAAARDGRVVASIVGFAESPEAADGLPGFPA